MVHDGVLGLPHWLVVGIELGVLCSLLVAGLFLVADRLYPETRREYRSRSGESRRRTEIREYLDAIEEPYAEDHYVQDQHVDFYLPARDVAITFDARAYYRIERSETYPVLVEHEMPGRQLGHRLPFEVPETNAHPGGTDADRPNPTTRAFAELGLPTTASLDEVKSAYRHKVKEVHPDQGGDEAEFQRVREAYTTAKKNAN